MTPEERQSLINQYASGFADVVEALRSIPPSSLTAHPIAGKWSAAEIVHHLADSEMTSAIRIRRLLCEDHPTIQGYDEAHYARRMDYNSREIGPSLEAFRAARISTLPVLSAMTPADWLREGTHTESGRYTSEDWLRSYGNHARDHAEQIRRLGKVLGSANDVNAAGPGRPAAEEHNAYFGRYISLVPEGGLLPLLESQFRDTQELMRGISEPQSLFRYAPGKWSIREMVGHLIDGERIFSYRALRFARNDKTALPGFEQDDFVTAANFDGISLGELMEEWSTVRRSTIQMLSKFAEEAWTRRGVANSSPMSARAAAYVIAGHELYHRERLIKDYVPALSKA